MPPQTALDKLAMAGCIGFTDRSIRVSFKLICQFANSVTMHSVRYERGPLDQKCLSIGKEPGQIGIFDLEQFPKAQKDIDLVNLL